MLRNDDAAFSSYSSYLLYLFLQVGKIKVTAKQVLKILRIHCQNSALIMTNGIRQGRLGVDIFDKRNLDSCKFISDTVLQNTASSIAIFSLQPEEYKLVPQCMVHNLSGFYFLCFHFCCFWQEGKRREAKHRETPSSVHYYFLFFQVGCTVMFYSTQESVQPKETGESCIRT